MNESEVLKIETTNQERAVAEGGQEVRMLEDTEEEELWEDRRSGEAQLLDIPHKQGDVKGGGREYDDDYIGDDSNFRQLFFDQFISCVCHIQKEPC